MENRIRLSANPEIRASNLTKYFFVVFSGVLLTAAFPPWDLSWIAWFALVPLFKALENEPLSRAFKLGFAAGVIHNLTLVYWITVVLGRYGNLNMAVSAAIFLLLCLYLSLYLGLFSLLARLSSGSGLAPIMWACFWVVLEYVRAHFLTGFPWCLLGYTQHYRLSLIQVADLTGVYGLSFLIVLANGMIYHLIFRRGRLSSSLLRWEALFTAVALGATLAYGYQRLSADASSEEGRRTLRVAAVQANIDQSLKWDAGYRGATMNRYEELTRSAYDFKPQLIVWPETSVPFFFQDNPVYSPLIFSLVQESGSDLIFGSPAYRQTDSQVKYFNRAYLITPGGKGIQAYDKVHLVPFGEYVPLKGVLTFVNRLVPAAGDFESGTRIAPLESRDFSAGMLICFEAIFPELARAQTNAGAQVLVNLTNDAWFGKTSAPYQHLAMSVFRAVENGRPLIRAANTGFSAFIDSSGRIEKSSGLFQEAVLKETVRLSDSDPTFYTRHGDVFAWALIALAAVGILAGVLGRKGKKRR